MTRIVKADAYCVERQLEPPSPVESRVCESSPGGEILLGLLHNTIVLGEPQTSTLLVGDTSGSFNFDNPLASVDWNDVVGRGVQWGHIGQATPEVSANTLWRAVPWPNGLSSGGTSTIRVWDWQADALYQYDAPGGRRIVGPSYANGRFYWVEHDAPFGNARFRSALPDLTDNIQIGVGTFFGGPFLNFYVLASGHLVATWYSSNGRATQCDVLRPSTSVAIQWPFLSSAAIVHNIHRENSPGVPLSAGGWTVVSNETNRLDYSASYVTVNGSQIIETDAWDDIPFSSNAGLLGPPHHVAFFQDGRVLVHWLFTQSVPPEVYIVIAEPFDDDNAVSIQVGDCDATAMQTLREIFPYWE